MWPLNSQPDMVKGPTEPPLWHNSLGSFIDDQASRYGDRPAIISSWQSTQISYRQLADRSWAVAKALYFCGLRHGDSVGILAGNRIEYLEALLGAARLGCPVVVLNSTYTPNELQSALLRSECKLLFAASQIGPRKLHEHIEGVQRQKSEQEFLEHIVLFDGLKGVDGGPGAKQYLSFLRSAIGVDDSVVRQLTNAVKPEDVVNLQFTSGTTGAPKAAELTSFNVINNGRFVGERLKLTPDDIVCCPPPLFHCFGLVIGFLACFCHGSALLFASDSFNAGRVMQAIFDERASVLLSVPTMFMAEMDVIRKTGRKPTHLRCVVSAGSALSTAGAHQIQREMGVDKILICYGMTETSPVSFMTSLEDSPEKRLKTLGRVFPHTVGKVVDRDGNILGIGQRGELCTSGFCLQRGYFKNKEKTDEVMKRDSEGTMWMHTGDEVLIDEGGYLHLTGRIKDIIIRGGENIFPGEIEDRLLEHPAVGEAGVVGLKNEKYGEVVAAFIRFESTSKDSVSDAELSSWVTQRLGRHKTPAHIFQVGENGVIPDFPKTGSGKHQKHVLRKIGDKLLSEKKLPHPRL